MKHSISTILALFVEYFLKKVQASFWRISFDFENPQINKVDKQSNNIQVNLILNFKNSGGCLKKQREGLSISNA